MERKEWYLEYEIKWNRPGLLGEISSLLGMLSINIIMINGVENSRRGMLLITKNDENISRLRSILEKIDIITVLKLRRPLLKDRMAVRHGKYIHTDKYDRKKVRFVREELGILVDFMAELFKQEGHKLIGIRGMPRVGKTESVVAATVSANKRWLFVSSTMIKQTIRSSFIAGEYDPQNIFIIDGVVSKQRANEEHWRLIREVMQLPAVKVVEHPDIFVEATEYTMDDFDYIIELRRDEEEEITYDQIKNPSRNQGSGFNMFDF